MACELVEVAFHSFPGRLVEAVQHMVTFHQLARSHRWHTEAGDSLHRIGCEHLRRLYTKMADQVRRTWEGGGGEGLGRGGGGGGGGV